MKNTLILLIIVLSFSFCSRVNSQSISYTDKQKLVQYAYAMLDKSFDKEVKEIPKISNINDYHKMFITFMNDNKIRCCQSGRHKKSDPLRTELDIKQAVKRNIRDKRFGGVLKAFEVDNVEVIFNFLYGRKQVTGNLKQLKNKIELGVHAIEIVNDRKKAYFKESVAITKNYKLKKILQRLCRKSRQKKNCYKSPETKIYIYDTITFWGNRKGEISDLYRYNIPIKSKDINNDFLYKRLKLTQSWFHNNINDQGLLQYTYYPSKDRYTSKNNDIRQMATLWSIGTLKDFLKDESLNTLARNTLDHYLGGVTKRKNYVFLNIKGKTAIAFNAFLILALLQYPDYPKSDDWLEQLGNGILSLQKEDGSFRTYFESNRMSGVNFYPGEAMLSLIKLYKKTGDKRYLKAVVKAFPYYRRYWRRNKNTAFIPWHSQVYYLLHKETKNSELPRFVFEMNDWLIDKYQIRESKYPDQIGGFPKRNPRNSSASYLEGINDAYSLAQLVKDEKHIAKYRETIGMGTRFILHTQFTKENSFYVKNPSRVIGGFRGSLTSIKQRNDYTQHALMALIKAYHNGIFK